ncbi:peroxiredoxin [Kibdelosporangium banguiense]|uniref:Peroxiredoxin n=1 Tax=Kibdelosporangium banguiense TaxID=1365924 RepID=A0ABS4TVF6_9PSEU|nr:TlpA disulfide reductase family protein [Kibdelosporangium banguiense]MBP2327911.1 peroxiredoxin [Kibdelosporangium banguiense]
MRLAVLALATVLALTGCSGAVTYVAAPSTAPPAPAFQLKLLDGSTLDLAEQWKTRPVVLVFFESWCQLCTQQQPGITALSEEYRDTVLFVGVGHESSSADAAKFVRDNDIDYPVGLDASGEIWRRYRVDEPPLIALISKGGRLVRGWPGGTTELDKQIRQFLVA